MGACHGAIRSGSRLPDSVERQPTPKAALSYVSVKNPALLTCISPRVRLESLLPSGAASVSAPMSGWESPMLSKCANPSCQAPFQYLSEGKLFRIDRQRIQRTGPQLVTEKKPPRRLEHYWLCSHCAASMTVTWDSTKGVYVQPLRPFLVARAAASAAS